MSPQPITPKVRSEFLSRFSEVTRRLTGASEDVILDLLDEQPIQTLEEHMREKALDRHIGLERVYRYAPYRWFYYVLCRLSQPSVVVETGVWYGVSSAFILEAFQANGKGELHSIDLPNARYVREDGDETTDAVGNPGNTGRLVPAHLRHRWHLILGRAQKRLSPLLESLSEIDMFVHDGEHTFKAMMLEFDVAYRFLKGGGILISDDIHFNNAFPQFVQKTDCESMVFQRRRNQYMGVIIKPKTNNSSKE